MTKISRKTAGAAVFVLVALWASPGMDGAFYWRRPMNRVARTSLQRPSLPRQPRAERVLRRGRRGIAADRVLVRFRPGVDEAYADALLLSYGFESFRRIPEIGVYSIRTAAGATVPETLAMLRRNPDVEIVRPDYRARLADIPNDPYLLSYQYNLLNRGGILDIAPDLQPQMTAGADVKATAAWDAAKGDAGTIIAIVDSGVDLTHPDLVDKIVSSGHDFANDDDDATDDVWHGTHVAGIAAADTDNGLGIAGVAWNCRILPVKVTDANGDAFYSWIIDGIVWAVDNGADVINISLGGDVDDPFLEDACRYAHDNGVVIAAAAGNDGLMGVLYPAAYDQYVLAVAASDYNDAIAEFANYGPQMDVAAPGVWILGPAPQWYVGEGFLPYLFASGTSMAAPHVAGMAALIRSAKPKLSADDVMKIIRYTADDINRTAYPGRDDHAGYGRINMARALVPVILD
jgi:subtilisin family serine protease